MPTAAGTPPDDTARHVLLASSPGRHPGEGRELVDQAADSVDLADDRGGTHRERLGIAR